MATVVGRPGASARAGRVLHVVIGAGSGVVSVVEDHMASTPEYEHHALVALDTQCSDTSTLASAAASLTELPAGAVAKAVRLRAEVERIDPDVVHAHSSFAGAYVRSAIPRRRQGQVVYTPHCFAFERTDITRWTRSVFRGAESAFAWRGGQIAACSPLEADLANALRGRPRVAYVPNVARPWPITGSLAAGRGAGNTAAMVVTSGRLTAMKGPDLFAAAARGSRRRGCGFEFTWIGGQDDEPEAEEVLQHAGVKVTGWLPREDARRRLTEADVYVHCACWEGAPLTILEAADAGIPVVARRTSSLEALGVAPLYETVDELLDILGEYPSGPAFDVARTSVTGLRKRHTPDLQRAALIEVYRRARERRPR